MSSPEISRYIARIIQLRPSYMEDPTGGEDRRPTITASRSTRPVVNRLSIRTRHTLRPVISPIDFFDVDSESSGDGLIMTPMPPNCSLICSRACHLLSIHIARMCCAMARRGPASIPERGMGCAPASGNFVPSSPRILRKYQSPYKRESDE